MESLFIKHIHILSPSGTINPDFIDGAAQRLQQWGYKVSIAPHAYGANGRFSGTDKERIADLKQALQDPSIDAILCARGGYGLQRIIDKLTLNNQQQRKQTTNNQQPYIIGFSDITALHQLNALSTVNGQPATNHQRPSLHSLMCKQIATLPEDSLALQLFRRALACEPLSYDLAPHPLNRLGSVQGTLVGGNLSVLYGLQGTPYDLNHVIDAHPEGVILFIEDIAERHYHIDRMMQNLRLSGVLSRIKGLIVGQFADCEPDSLMGCSIYDTILHAAYDYNYPVLFDFPAGHVDDNRPIYLNHHATLTCSGQSATLLQP